MTILGQKDVYGDCICRIMPTGGGADYRIGLCGSYQRRNLSHAIFHQDQTKNEQTIEVCEDYDNATVWS